MICAELLALPSGRVTKPDLFELVCKHFGISTSGGVETSADASSNSAEKPSLDTLPADVQAAYRQLPSLAIITSGWSVASLCRIPHFDAASVKHYLLNSADKSFDGDSLRAHKQLRAYQLLDERHLHNVEANLWASDAKFWQDAAPTLEKFFRDFVVLELVTRRLKRHTRLLPA